MSACALLQLSALMGSPLENQNSSSPFVNFVKPVLSLWVNLILVLSHQKEEGKVQGQLNHTDSSQYIRDLKSQIRELKHEVRLVKSV